MKIKLFPLAAIILSLTACGPKEPKDVIGYGYPDGIKTIMQNHGSWKPDIDVRCDAMQIVHPGSGIGALAETWRDHGYIPCFQDAMSWDAYDRYADFFNGDWDGVPHHEDVQRDIQGRIVQKNHFFASLDCIKYFEQAHIKPAIDAGVTHIFLEEPEFWAKSGYSEGFKREWQAYYGEPWRPQDESPEATYMSSKLKYYLNLRMIDSCFTFAKAYGRSKGLDVKCYIPTHTLLNYSMWNIVSPEASLATLESVDGYIVQAWTGTSRYPEYYNGLYKERTLENGYLEYACMKSMTEPTGRKVWFLTDPIEDAKRSWEDYGVNYHATFTAQLLHPEVADFQVLPSPSRIYNGHFRKSETCDSLITIPAYYSTMMQVMVNALQQMPQSSNRVSGTQGISVLMGNSLMFQRFPTHEGYEDPELASFYGLAMPLVKRGLPIAISHLENLQYEKALKDVKLLLMTYANMKPLDPAAHDYIAAWVEKGGQLIYAGRDDDPYQTVSEWWNTGDNAYKAPADHLFEKMSIPAGAPEGVYTYGKGQVTILRQDPQEYAMHEGGHEKLLSAVEAAFPGKVSYKNNFDLRRGPYRIVAVMDESVSEEPFCFKGRYIDLFDPELPIRNEVSIPVGSQGVFFDIDLAGKAPKILAAASRAYDEKVEGRTFSFVAKSPINTDNVSRVLLPRKPKSVIVNGSEQLDPSEWDPSTGTYRLCFPNDPDGVSVRISW